MKVGSWRGMDVRKEGVDVTREDVGITKEVVGIALRGHGYYVERAWM